MFQLVQTCPPLVAYTAVYVNNNNYTGPHGSHSKMRTNRAFLLKCTTRTKGSRLLSRRARHCHTGLWHIQVIYHIWNVQSICCFSGNEKDGILQQLDVSEKTTTSANVDGIRLNWGYCLRWSHRLVFLLLRHSVWYACTFTKAHCNPLRAALK